MNKFALITLLLVYILLIAGCWSQVEIEDRAIISALGVDQETGTGKLEVTVQIIKPGEIQPPALGGGSPPAVAVYSESGYNLTDALRNLSQQVGQILFLSEINILVMGEAVAKDGIGSVLDYIARHHEPSLRSWVVVARGKARDVLETETPVEEIWGLELGALVKSTRLHGRAPAVTVLDFLKTVSSKTTMPVATGMEITGKEKKTAEQEAAPGNKPIISGTAVFKDYKLTGWLDERETRGFLWVKGEIEKSVIVVPSPQSPEKLMALEIMRARSKIKPEINDGRITLTVVIRAEGDLGEVDPDNVEISRPDVIEKIEVNIKEVIEKEVLAAINKAQELNVDVFGFGEAVRRKHPRKWPQYEEKWEKLFSHLDIKVETKANIRKKGLITDPLRSNLGE